MIFARIIFCIHAKCIFRLGKFLTPMFPKADKAEAAVCQDLRQLVFNFFENERSILVAISHGPFVDHLLFFKYLV